MKTDEIPKIKSTVDQLREIRDKVSAEIQDMSFDQLKKYIEQNLHTQSTIDRKKKS